MELAKEQGQDSSSLDEEGGERWIVWVGGGPALDRFVLVIFLPGTRGEEGVDLCSQIGCSGAASSIGCVIS